MITGITDPPVDAPIGTLYLQQPSGQVWVRTRFGWAESTTTMIMRGITDPPVDAPIGTLYLQQPSGQFWMRTRSGWAETEYVDDAFYRKNTNEWRRAQRRVEIRERRNKSWPLVNKQKTFLQLVANYISLEDPPLADLEGAFREVEERLIAAAACRETAKTRKRIKWLGRWARRISAELDRRRNEGAP